MDDEKLYVYVQFEKQQKSMQDEKKCEINT